MVILEISWKLYLIYFDFNDPINSQFCSKLWTDWTLILHAKIISVITRFGLWAHKLLMKCAPDALVSLGPLLTWGPGMCYSTFNKALLLQFILIAPDFLPELKFLSLCSLQTLGVRYVSVYFIQNSACFVVCVLEYKDKNSRPDKGNHISTERSWSQETCSQALFINA